MAESEMLHRHTNETNIISTSLKREQQGMIISAAFSIVMVLIGAILLLADKQVGWLVIFAPAVFNAGNYIYHKVEERKQQNDESK